jgi:hypothetical protein
MQGTPLISTTTSGVREIACFVFCKCFRLQLVASLFRKQLAAEAVKGKS